MSWGALVEVNPFFFVEYISMLAMKIFEMRINFYQAVFGRFHELSWKVKNATWTDWHTDLFIEKFPLKSVMDLSNIAITLETSGPRLLKEYFLTN